MKVQCSLIWELMLYEFKLDHNAMEATKNICCVKGEGTVDYNKVTRWFKKFCFGGKNLEDQARSDRIKSVDSDAMLPAIEVNLVRSTQRVWDKLSISEPSMVCHLHDFSKNIWNSRIGPHTKILQNFWLTQVFYGRLTSTLNLSVSMHTDMCNQYKQANIFIFTSVYMHIPIQMNMKLLNSFICTNIHAHIQCIPSMLLREIPNSVICLIFVHRILLL